MSKVYDLHKFKPEKVDAMERWARRRIRRADDTAQECGQAGDVSRSDGLKGFQAPIGGVGRPKASQRAATSQETAMSLLAALGANPVTFCDFGQIC